MMTRSKPIEDESLSELLSKSRPRTPKRSSGATKGTTRFMLEEGRDEEQGSRMFLRRAESGVHAAKKGSAKAGHLVGKGTRAVGKGVGVAGKSTARLGAKTGKGALSATRLVAKNTVKVGKGTVGVVGNLPGNAIDLTVKGVTNLPGNAIHLAGQVTNLAARTLKRNEIAATAASGTRTTSKVSKIEVEISCRNLRRKDAFAECDAFCVLWQVPSGYGSEATVGKLDESFSTLGGASASVSLASLMSGETTGKRRKRPRVTRMPTNAEKEIGRTEVIKGNKNPTFTHKFEIDFRFQEEQTYVLRVYDEDLEFCQDLREHDFLGGTVFTLGELMGVGKRMLKRPLRAVGNEKNKSVLCIQGSEKSSTRSVMEFRFSAEDLTEKDKVIDRQEDLFFHVLKMNTEDQTWHPVYKSEVVMHNSRPTWAKARVPLPELCNDDICNPLKISFWDWVRGGQSEELGYVETTCQMLVAEAERGIPVFDVWRDKQRAFARTKTTKQGRLKVLRAEVKPVPTILEYVNGGCKLDVTIAVDCSIHNGDPETEGSLHNRPGSMWLNDYQAAINKIGGVMEPYTKSGDFNVWGYGATLRGEDAPHFPMGYDGTAKGVSGLLDAYDTTFIENPHYMEPAEDSNIAALIQSAMYRAIQKSENEQCYSVLCILTAGKIGENMRETIDTLCTAAEDAPISIVIIGIGDSQEDFEDIKLMVANGGKLRHSNGVPIARDIIGFAAFNDFEENSGKVVAEALKELPEQLVEYFTINGIEPRPPVTKEDEMSASMKDGSSKSAMGSSSRRRNGESRRKRSSKSPQRGTRASSSRRSKDTMSSSMKDSSKSTMGGSSRRRNGRSNRPSTSPQRGARASRSPQRKRNHSS